ncbi:MAG: HlyD family type I secretion periplasmic adaptor subunit [Magnetococcales bacterium]|nr:HlyD family type I secretion periplasmic adaptor subunit [Magnetococcales bacterium]
MFQNRFSRHLSDAQILEETGVSWLVKLFLAETILLTLFFLWLFAYINTDEAVKATGEFLPIQGVQLVHSAEGGIVTEIIAKNDQLVEKGSLLLRLSNAVINSEQQQVEARLMGLMARAIRQEAFLQGSKPNFESIPDKYAAVVREQIALLDTQNQVRQKGLEVFDAQIKQKQSEIDLSTQNLLTVNKSLAINTDLLVLQENLGKKKLVSHLSQLEAKRVYLESEGKSKTLSSQIKQNQSALQEVKEKKTLFEKDLQNQAKQELGAINNEISQVKTLLERVTDRKNNQDVLSPIQGRVQNSRVKTLGSVFNPSDILMEIVPENSELQLTVQITPKDIGYVSPGQKVSIQVSSYDYNRFGGAKGELISISPFTQMDAEKKAFYKGIVKLESPFVGDPKFKHAILSGMKANADIISGNRSILSYILNPLTHAGRP